MALYAGVSETNITPPPGVWMSGYAFRPTGCTGVHDDLFARALVVHAGEGATIALVTCDLIGLDVDVVDRVREEIGRQIGIPPSAVMLAATHTHGGPSTRTFRAMGPPDAPYMSVLERKLVGVARQAVDALQPASLAHATARAQIGVNRRQATGSGTVLGRNWGGPVDDRVRVVVVRDSRGEAFAVAINHACHAVTMGGDNLLVTADHPGATCAAIQEMTAGAAMPLYLQGCCGDVNPLRRGSWEAVAHNGRVVADAVLEATGSATEPLEPSVRAKEVVVELPFASPPAVEEAERALAEADQALAAERERGHPGAVMHAEGMRDHAEFVVRVARDGIPAEPLRARVQCLTVGALRILGLPFEPFVEYALRLERACSHPLIVTGYANGVHGYLPTAAAFAQGGYEVESANRYYGTLMLDPACERIVLSACERLLEQA